MWAKAIGSTENDVSYGIAIDATGNVYTTGIFGGSVDFDPSASVSNLTSMGGNDIFVQKLDASGNFAWAKAMGGAGLDYGVGISIDVSSNVLIGGFFQGIVDFDPGAGTSNLTSAGGNDIFVSKLDASGNFGWAKRMGGTNDDVCEGIKTDASGNVLTTGYFSGTADFDPSISVSNLISAGSDDIFVSKLNASGNFVWAKQMGGITSDGGFGISVDASGNVYTTGYFYATVDFNSDAGVSNFTSAGRDDIFIQKLDASGNFVWASAMGGTDTDNGFDIAVDASGNVIVVGYFNGTIDFDPSASIFNLTSAGSQDIFVQKLSGILLSTHKTEVANSNNKFNVYPNPAQNELNVSVSNASFEKTSLQIINIEGKIMQSTEETFAGNKIFTLNTQNLPAGMYVVRSQTANNTQSQRLVITK